MPCVGRSTRACGAEPAAGQRLDVGGSADTRLDPDELDVGLLEPPDEVQEGLLVSRWRKGGNGQSLATQRCPVAGDALVGLGRVVEVADLGVDLGQGLAQ